MRRIRLKSEDVLAFASVAIILGALVFVYLRFFYVPPLPSPVGQNCGTITYRYQPASAAPANCLWNAYLKCRTATLTYSYTAIDTGVTHVIIVQPGTNGCTVDDTADGWSANFLGHHKVITYHCAGIVPPQNGVFTVFGCGDEGNIAIAVSASS